MSTSDDTRPAESTGTAEPSVSELLARKKPQRISVTVLVDPEARQRLTLTFRALPRPQWDELVAVEEYRPTDEQKLEWAKAQIAAGVRPDQVDPLAYNYETFPPALVAAACVEPKLTPDDTQVMWDPGNDAWSAAELGRIFEAAWQVNTTADLTVRWGKAARPSQAVTDTEPPT